MGSPGSVRGFLFAAEKNLPVFGFRHKKIRWMILGSIWKGHKSYAIRFIDPIKYNVDTIKLTYLIKALMYPVCCSLLNITYLHYIYFVKKLYSFKTLDFSSNRHEINRGIIKLSNWSRNCPIFQTKTHIELAIIQLTINRARNFSLRIYHFRETSANDAKRYRKKDPLNEPLSQL